MRVPADRLSVTKRVDCKCHIRIGSKPMIPEFKFENDAVDISNKAITQVYLCPELEKRSYRKQYICITFKSPFAWAFVEIRLTVSMWLYNSNLPIP